MSTLVQPAPQKLKTPTLPKGDDCLVVIFGGTGDLTHRKLIPALYDLACVGCTTPQLPDARHRTHQARRRRVSGRACTMARRRRKTPATSPKMAGRILPSACTTSSAMPGKPEFYPAAEEEDRRDAEERRQQERAVLCLDFGVAGAADRGRPGRSRAGQEQRRLDAHHPGEAFRQRPGERARAERDGLESLRGERGLSHRSLPGQRDRAEHHDVPLRQLHVRAGVEPQLHRLHRDHGGGDAGRRGPRRILRRDRRAARHGGQSHAPVADADGDGAARVASMPTRCARRKCRCCAPSAR